mgnify:CR=1 FL=1
MAGRVLKRCTTGPRRKQHPGKNAARLKEPADLLMVKIAYVGNYVALSHLIVITAEAGIQWFVVYIVFNGMLDTRFRGYDKVSNLRWI